MKVLEYYKLENKEYWLEKIALSDWGAGKYLYELIKDNQLKKFCGHKTEVLLLVHEEELISFCTYAFQDDINAHDYYPWLGFVYTFPKYRGNRYFGILVKYANALAVKDNYKNLYISTNEIGLYEKYGFKFFGKMKDIHNDESLVYIKEVCAWN